VSDPTLSPIGADERARAIKTVVSAFTEDPVERWLYPGDQQYWSYFPEFVTAFGGRSFDVGTAWILDDVSGVAMWLPPENHPDEDAVVEILTISVAPDKHEALFAVLEQMDRLHPTFPHWYLPWLAVDPSSQGSGIGGRLLSQCLAVVDADGLPAYLEAPNPRTVPFYQRHGFGVTGIVQAGSCPPVTCMLREAQ
jgi:ribosomal protein S18 acetylase RimI-like enzyme